MRVDQLWRFPVKSMLGESVDEVELTDRGVVGDRTWALVDATDGKIVSAKNPRKWPRVLELAASWVEPPAAGSDDVPPVSIAFPDGSSLRSDDAAIHGALSAFLGRDVHLTSTPPATVTMEETWPDLEGLAPAQFIADTKIETDDPDEVVSDITMAMAAPPGTFFDLATLHLVTTGTLDALTAAYPGGAFDVRRYRPNVLVRTDDDQTGYVENAWSARRSPSASKAPPWPSSCRRCAAS